MECTLSALASRWCTFALVTKVVCINPPASYTLMRGTKDAISSVQSINMW